MVFQILRSTGGYVGVLDISDTAIRASRRSEELFMGTVVAPDGVILTPVKIIEGSNGLVLHALKATDSSFAGFGEAYFSTVYPGARKGWKKHFRMTLNLVVPVGCIRFVLVDDRLGSNSRHRPFFCTLSRNNYQRLTVPPGIWTAFEGLGETESVLMNVANIPHDPLEAENKPVDDPHMTMYWL